MKNILRIIFSLALVFAAVALASLFISPDASAWYASLVKPDFRPPSAVFAPVWIVVYILMAIVLARVWMLKESGPWRMWVFVFCTQLLLGVLWIVLFFSLHGLLLSSIDAVVLWFCVIILTLGTWDIDRFSFWLLVPYLAWVTFALILNVTIWWLN